MLETEIIVVNSIPDDVYDLIAEESISYAIISKPFTIRRIGNQTIEAAILNIFKGKLAEGLFEFFCNANHLPTDWLSCKTPFWATDRRDFICNEIEWDVKNNFVYHAGDLLTNQPYTDLPALIPARKKGDQWDSRFNYKNSPLSNEAGFVFTFMKGAEIVDGKRSEPFCQLILSDEQINMIQRAENKYNGKSQIEAPFDENIFWREFEKRGEKRYIQFNSKPYLIITGCASDGDWGKFQKTGAGEKLYRDFKFGKNLKWYHEGKNGSLNFLNSTLFTTITNMTTRVSYLPSFFSRHPQLKREIRYGTLLSNISKQK